VPRKIMLVHGFRPGRMSLWDQLERTGYNAVVCDSAEEAKRRIYGARPDAVIAAFALPGENGQEFAKWTKAQGRFPDLPFILLVRHKSEVDTFADRVVRSSAQALEALQELGITPDQAVA
jgi:CheY-like chemotaxis protein